MNLAYQLTKKISKKAFIISLLLLLFYLVTRLLYLTNFPMLNDESIYFYWALRMVDDPRQIMIPLSEGRQPLFIWLVSNYLKIFQDPVLAGRLVSVSAGFVTMLGIFFVTKEVFKRHSYALAAVVLYIASPFALVYDRLALLDSLVTAFTIWSIYFTVLLVRTLRLDIAYTLGFVIGGGIITKTNGVFNLLLLPFSLIFLNLKSNKIRTLLRFAGLLIVVAITSQVVNSIITFSPQYSRILDVNQIFIIPKKEFIKLPFSFIVSNFLYNFNVLMRYFAEYFTFPYLLLLFTALIEKSFRKEKLFLLLYFLVPLCIFALFGRQLLPRYIYFMTISLIPLCGYGIVILYKLVTEYMKDTPLLQLLYASVILCIPIVVSFSVIRDIRTAFIPLPEKINYAAHEEEFVRESTSYLTRQAKDKNILLVVEGYIGWSPNMYQVLFHDNPNIIIKSYPRIESEIPKEVIEAANTMPTYIMFPRREGDSVPANFPLKKIIDKTAVLNSGSASANYFMQLYQVNPRR